MTEQTAGFAIDRADGRSMRSGFLRSAGERPDAPCLVIKGESFTYAAVEEAARRWAGAIVGRLGRPARRIGIFASRSFESYTGVLAALCSGATFVPLNPSFPQDRTAEMIRQGELDAIILDRHGLLQIEAVLAGIERMPLLLAPLAAAAPSSLAILFEEDMGREEPLAQLPPLTPADIAYLLFTSGSTGKPKGVPVTHGNALHFIDFAVDHYGIVPEDRFSQTFDQTFDLSIFDLFVAWERGASVFALQSLDLIAPARFIAKNALTVWFSVPSIPALMRKKGSLRPDTLPSLRLSLFCGEPLPQETARAWQAAAPASALENLYGPTELTIACLWYRWDDAASPAECVNGVVPIGRPFPGLGVALVDEDLNPASSSEGGELCVCGPQTTPGYWRDEEKTADRFVHLPGLGFPSPLFYRTGDRVKRLENGQYVYLGRTDHQIKVRGYRVELGEIEARLRAEPQVVEAIAAGWPISDGTAEGIVAFVSGTELDIEGMVRNLAQALPDYMVPAEIHRVDEMPLNANGKIDRKALIARAYG